MNTIKKTLHKQKLLRAQFIVQSYTCIDYSVHKYSVYDVLECSITQFAVKIGVNTHDIVAFVITRLRLAINSYSYFL